MIRCRTSDLDDLNDSKSNVRCILRNNCFFDVDATETLLAIQREEKTQKRERRDLQEVVELVTERNYVSGFSVVGFLAADQVCDRGNGLRTAAAGFGGVMVSCSFLKDIGFCPLTNDPVTDDVVIVDDDKPISPSVEDDDFFPLPKLTRRHPACTHAMQCDVCEGDCDHNRCVFFRLCVVCIQSALRPESNYILYFSSYSNDRHCKGNLECFQRQGADRLAKVPGCRGNGDTGIDYCYDPRDAA